MLIFVSLIGYLVYFDKVKSDDFINSPYNTRQDTFSDRVVRGKIESSDGEVLAQTNVYEDGTEERTYPYANIFSHVVGYDSNGKSGLESEANFLLLTSHEFFLNQMKNEFKSQKNMGDTVVSTLNADLQTTAYQALGDRRGAVVAIEPSTGKILVEVSKPDFDPSTIAQNWEALVNDQNDSSLLNRATNGAYPPGSVFKIVTALDYFRTRGTLEDFSYLCEGGITKEGHTIRCYGGEVHGQEDFYSAFAHSCNSAFAEIGTMLGGSSLRSTAEDLLFNKDLPLTSYRKSTFSLNFCSQRCPASVFDETDGAVLIVVFYQSGDKIIHEWINTCIISSSCKNQLGIAESIADCLGHIVSCKVIDQDFGTSSGFQFISK